MPRPRRKFKYDELEEHTTAWAIDRLDDLRDMAQEIISNDRYLEGEKDFILESLADQIFLLLELLEPLTHDQANLVAWSQEFVDEYCLFSKNRDD